MQRGFTIIEVMVTLAIVATLAAFAFPAMQDLIQAGAVRAASSDFYAALIAARSEAIKRRAAMKVAPIGSNWNSGWKVTLNVGGNLFQQTDALRSDIAVLPAGASTAIIYGSNGRVSSGNQTVTFYSPTQNKVAARCVSVDPNGLPRVRTDTDKDATNGCN
jgi:type IV fimbrial biogenesis protein FimT